MCRLSHIIYKYIFNHNLSVEVYTENEDGHKPVNEPRNKLTLTTLAEKIDKLDNDLKGEMTTGFRQVNERIDKMDARLDYIVKANDLKDLPNRK